MIEQEPEPTPEVTMREQGDPWTANRDRMHQDLIRDLADPPSGVEAYPIDPKRLALIETVKHEDEEAAKVRDPEAPRTVVEWGEKFRADEAERLRVERERTARGASAMHPPRSD